MCCCCCCSLRILAILSSLASRSSFVFGRVACWAGMLVTIVAEKVSSATQKNLASGGMSAPDCTYDRDDRKVPRLYFCLPRESQMSLSWSKRARFFRQFGGDHISPSHPNLGKR